MSAPELFRRARLRALVVHLRTVLTVPGVRRELSFGRGGVPTASVRTQVQYCTVDVDFLL